MRWNNKASSRWRFRSPGWKALDYAALLNPHIETTRQKMERLEQALGSAGGSAPTLKETVTCAAGTVGATVHGLLQDETLKNLYAGHPINTSRSLPIAR
jgi:hypothetical protein